MVCSAPFSFTSSIKLDAPLKLIKKKNLLMLLRVGGPDCFLNKKSSCFCKVVHLFKCRNNLYLLQIEEGSGRNKTDEQRKTFGISLNHTCPTAAGGIFHSDQLPSGIIIKGLREGTGRKGHFFLRPGRGTAARSHILPRRR